MKYYEIADGLRVSAAAAGCMRVKAMSQRELDAFARGCLDAGINFFDHADIYGRGACETAFGNLLKADKALRGKIVLQTKCGIVIDGDNHAFDFSYEYIMRSVEGSLKRLQTNYIDILLLHRPDALMEPDEIARAFSELRAAGKVRHFGVSNQNPSQMRLIMSALDMPLVANQMQFSAAFTPLVDAGLNVNMNVPQSVMRDGGTLEFCRLNNIAAQAWSPYQFGFFEGVFLGSEKYPALNAELELLAKKYGVTPTSIATAFILRHPAFKQVITGSTKIERVLEAAKGADVDLTRYEWYSVYRAAGNKLP
ncbi:MAG: aldo/keto reductase [Clostridiales bacterium]|jgi:predicted oxidoreductase|nr:aldo/keto reductase [Clostridiales bacterium]